MRFLNSHTNYYNSSKGTIRGSSALSYCNFHYNLISIVVFKSLLSKMVEICNTKP